MSDDMFRNQVGILDIDDFDYLKIAIIGVGSIGSFLAVALNKLGFKNIMLIDDDKVDLHNVATQCYSKKDVGRYKVSALRDQLDGNITRHNKRIVPKHRIKADVIFICVDSLKQRKIIMKSILDTHAEFKNPKLIIDGRMHRLVFRVFTVPLKEQKLLNKYVKGMMGKEFSGSCTEKGIVQNVFAVVSVMVEQLKKVIKGEKFYATVNCDFETLNFIQTTPIEKIGGK